MEIQKRIAKYLDNKGLGKETVLKLTLKGTVSPELSPNIKMLEKNASERVFSLRLEDCTVPYLDTDALRRDPTIKGEFFRSVEPLLNSQDPETRATAYDALRYGFCVLSGESIT